MSYDVIADRARWTDGENTACLTLLDGLDDDLVGRSLICRAISDTGAIYNLFYNYSSLNRPYKQITHWRRCATSYAQFTPPARHDKTVLSLSCLA